MLPAFCESTDQPTLFGGAKKSIVLMLYTFFKFVSAGTLNLLNSVSGVHNSLYAVAVVYLNYSTRAGSNQQAGIDTQQSTGW